MQTKHATIDTCQLDDDETSIVRIFVSDYYEESEELELEVSRDGIDFKFYFDGELVGCRLLSHEELFMLLIENNAKLLK